MAAERILCSLRPAFKSKGQLQTKKDDLQISTNAQQNYIHVHTVFNYELRTVYCVITKDIHHFTTNDVIKQTIAQSAPEFNDCGSTHQNQTQRITLARWRKNSIVSVKMTIRWTACEIPRGSRSSIIPVLLVRYVAYEIRYYFSIRLWQMK